MEKEIEVFERYLANSEDEIDLYKAIGLPLPQDFRYKGTTIIADEVLDVKQLNEYECIILFCDSTYMIVLADENELFIKVIDSRNKE